MGMGINEVQQNTNLFQDFQAFDRISRGEFVDDLHVV